MSTVIYIFQIISFDKVFFISLGSEMSKTTPVLAIIMRLFISKLIKLKVF